MGRSRTTKPGAGSGPDIMTSDMSRRSFMRWIWTGLVAAFAAELVWIIASFLRPRGGRALDPASVIVAGPVDRFAPDTVTAFPEGRFYLARLSDGGFLAMDRTCTHLGCTVPWDATKACFACPCHASSFDITGAVLAPPAPRPLDLYPVRIENGIVKVDTGQLVRRTVFAATQVVHP